jgi:hypothetical protein
LKLKFADESESEENDAKHNIEEENEIDEITKKLKFVYKVPDHYIGRMAIQIIKFGQD